MTTVVTGASMSLDGYIAGPDESGFDQLFAWYEAGDREYRSTHPELTFRLSDADHAYMAEFLDTVGVFVVGRRLFDLTDGWGGTHPFDRPVVVVTHRIPQQWIDSHPGAPFTFVTEGVPAAIERAAQIADGNAVGVNGGTMARQALEAGLLDEIRIDLVPLLLGGGTPFFDRLGTAPQLLDDPVITAGTRVTHLRYRVRR